MLARFEHRRLVWGSGEPARHDGLLAEERARIGRLAELHMGADARLMPRPQGQSTRMRSSGLAFSGNRLPVRVISVKRGAS